MSLGVDFGHVVAGTLIQSDGLGELLPPEIADFGPSMVTRGALLLGLDAVLFAANTIQEDVLMSDMRERFAELPPRMRRPHLSSKRRLVF
ncbi:MAG: hypothetical protein KDA24_12215 [Deltaproteobacteria bacterium]|nr:hypothetical protein [Deltaproteobacteria bacterium]